MLSWTKRPVFQGLLWVHGRYFLCKEAPASLLDVRLKWYNLFSWSNRARGASVPGSDLDGAPYSSVLSFSLRGLASLGVEASGAQLGINRVRVLIIKVLKPC
jgi:hypothetical protein